MNVDEIITKNKLLEEENKKLQNELIQTKEHLKKYTAPSNMKKYYENHKEEIKQKVLANCKSGNYSNFGKYKVAKVEDLDGYKYFFENGDWLMIRASGTEPVLRTYAESGTKEAAFDILNDAKATLLS